MSDTSKAKPVALVTGAGKTSGIGLEVCRQLAAAGYLVFLSARSAETAGERAEALSAEGLDVRGIALDVTRADSIAEAVQVIERDFGSLDVLVSNAAASAIYGETVEAADLSAMRSVFDATFFGAWELTKAVLPLLRRRDAARIVFVSSGAGSHGDSAFGLATGNAMGPSYATAKAALNALTSSLAHELRAEGILVNAVCPGLTATFPGAEQMGARPVSDGAAGIVWAATLPKDGPSGGFFRDGQPLPW